jgi:hypothetical protein
VIDWLVQSMFMVSTEVTNNGRSTLSMMEQQSLNWYFSIHLISMIFDQSEEAMFNVQLLRMYVILEDLVEPHLRLNRTSLLGSSTNPAEEIRQKLHARRT